MQIHDDQCIIAQCTPRGSGAIALLRLSGVDVRLVVSAIGRLASGSDINIVDSHTIHYGFIVDDQCTKIDQVMFLVMDGPRTFTGQNTIEITCHNNPFIIEAIINQAIKHGARIAQEGEFTRRAFANGKLDLLQAEAIADLINANTGHALKKSMAQLEGSLSNHMGIIERELVRAMAWCEASFEFLDEPVDHTIEIKSYLSKVIDMIFGIKKTFNVQQQIRQGIKIALIGAVNAGKSSLFNSLLNQKRAIVTPIAGTTRDAIEAGLYKNGNYWTLIDTAGLRITNDVIEQEGIRCSLEAAQNSDIIILVVDGSRGITDVENCFYQDILNSSPAKIIIVHSKSDLCIDSSNHLISKADIKISNQTKENIELLEIEIDKKINKLFAAIDSPFLINKRQHSLLVRLEIKLAKVMQLLDQDCNYELVSYHIKEALEDISELTGKSISEAGIDMVFKEFCVGK